MLPGDSSRVFLPYVYGGPGHSYCFIMSPWGSMRSSWGSDATCAVVWLLSIVVGIFTRIIFLRMLAFARCDFVFARVLARFASAIIILSGPPMLRGSTYMLLMFVFSGLSAIMAAFAINPDFSSSIRLQAPPQQFTLILSSAKRFCLSLILLRFTLNIELFLLNILKELTMFSEIVHALCFYSTRFMGIYFVVRTIDEAFVGMCTLGGWYPQRTKFHVGFDAFVQAVDAALQYFTRASRKYGKIVAASLLHEYVHWCALGGYFSSFHGGAFAFYVISIVTDKFLPKYSSVISGMAAPLLLHAYMPSGAELVFLKHIEGEYSPFRSDYIVAVLLASTIHLNYFTARIPENKPRAILASC